MTAPVVSAALMRSLRTLERYPHWRTVPQDSPVYQKLHDGGFVRIVGARYGHGAGRHISQLWEVELTDEGRALLAAPTDGAARAGDAAGDTGETT